MPPSVFTSTVCWVANGRRGECLNKCQRAVYKIQGCTTEERILRKTSTASCFSFIAFKQTMETKHKIIGMEVQGCILFLWAALTICKGGTSLQQTVVVAVWRNQLGNFTAVLNRWPISTLRWSGCCWIRRNTPTKQRVIVVTTSTPGQLLFSRSSQLRRRLIGHLTSNYSPRVFSVIEDWSAQVIQSDAKKERLQHHHQGPPSSHRNIWARLYQSRKKDKFNF